MKKYLFLALIMLFLPITVYAYNRISYNTSLNYVNNYITSFTGYQKYLETNTDKYSFSNSIIGSKDGFINSGYLNLDEYTIAGKMNSFLYDGQDYYTMTDKVGDSNSIYKISYEDENGYKSVLKSTEDPYAGIRVTQYINKNTKLKGNGTFSTPWEFINTDVAGPEVTFNNNSDTEWKNTHSVTITVEDTDSFVKKGQNIKYNWQTDTVCSTHMDEYTQTAQLSNINTDSKTATASVSESAITGQYYLCIAAGIEDTRGNSSGYTGTSGTFYFDNTKPVVSVGAVVNGSTVVITDNATDTDSEVRGYYYGYSLSTANCVPSDNELSNNTYTTPSLADGTYKVCSKVIDNAGNISDIDTKTVTISTKITYAQLIISYSCANISAGSAPHALTYTGNCNAPTDDGNGSWRIKFLSNGTLTLSKSMAIDVFIVGGGGGGANSGARQCGGGGGGYTATYSNINTVAQTGYAIVIGGGGNAGCYKKAGPTDGVASSFRLDASTIYSAGGGKKAPGAAGGAGGSGGSGYLSKNSSNWCNPVAGGVYGNNGGGLAGNIGAGQGTTTCEFGQGTLSGCNAGYTTYGTGGSAGSSATNCPSNTGKANTGEGGYGNPVALNTRCACPGNSGTVIIRDHRE